MAFSKPYAATLGDFARGRTSTTMGSTWLALYTAAPDIAGGDGTVNEATYTGYARVPCGTGGGSIFGAASGSTGTASNPSPVGFGTNTGVSTQTITHVGIVDSASGACVLREAAALTNARAYNTGDTPSFSALGLTDTFS